MRENMSAFGAGQEETYIHSPCTLNPLYQRQHENVKQRVLCLPQHVFQQGQLLRALPTLLSSKPVEMSGMEMRDEASLTFLLQLLNTMKL